MANVRSTTRTDSVPAIKVTTQKIQFTLPVPVASGESIDYYPPTGKSGKNTQLKLWTNLILAASVGSHYFSVENNLGLFYLIGEGAFNQHVRFAYGEWLNASVYFYPTDPVSATLMSLNLKFSDEEPLVVKYVNATDSPQVAQTYFIIEYEEVSK